MNEFELINLLLPKLPLNEATVVGAGDDCAVLEVGLPERWLLMKTDAVVEGVHFIQTTPPEKVGRKALGRCLSDIAAMAGTPLCAVITLALPKEFEVDWVRRMYDGLGVMAQQYATALVGGETTTNPERCLISIAMLGTVAKHKCPLRSGAVAGDALFVTGELGGSLAGKHLDFTPRLAEARWLVDHFPIHSLMDISDGLAGDLRHILRASHCGAELLASTIPISGAARQRANNRPPAKPPLVAALTDGEDFELLFTLPAHQAVALLDAWKPQFPELRLSSIGKITAEPGIRLRHADRWEELSAHGYTHFA